MDYAIRLEAPNDYFEVENLTREAFWNSDTPRNPLLERPDMPDCDEHYLAHLLRGTTGFVPQLDYVAVMPPAQGGGIIGNIMYSCSRVVAADGGETAVLTFGPLSVLPQYQSHGVGGALIRHTMAEATRLGWPAVFIFGHPGYYPRFGFENAQKYGVTTPDGQNFDAFMAAELRPGALAGVHGSLHFDPVFDMDLGPLPAFDKQFPKKEKRAHI